MTLGKKLKSARKGAGLTQEQMAEKLLVSRQAVTKWEADKGIPEFLNGIRNADQEFYLVNQSGKQFFIFLSKAAILQKDCCLSVLCRFLHRQYEL